MTESGGTKSDMAGNAVSVRSYRPADLEACRALWAALTEWHRGLYADPGIGGPDPGRHFDAHLERVGPERIWVAEAGGRVVGFAGCIPGDGEAELEPVVVDPAHRGRGVGALLTRAVVQAARESGVRYLKVRPVARNAGAIRFFHAAGFDVLGQVELFMDFRPPGGPSLEGGRRWRPGERLAGRDFEV